MNAFDIDYVVSLYPSRYGGYHSSKQQHGEVKLYLHTLWKQCNGDIDLITGKIIFMTLLERACLERAFNKCKMRDRCKIFTKHGKTFTCKMDYVVCQLRDLYFK